MKVAATQQVSAGSVATKLRSKNVVLRQTNVFVQRLVSFLIDNTNKLLCFVTCVQKLFVFRQIYSFFIEVVSMWAMHWGMWE